MAKVFFRIFMRLDRYAIHRAARGDDCAILRQRRHASGALAAPCCGVSTLEDGAKA